MKVIALQLSFFSLFLILLVGLSLLSPNSVSAQEGAVLGIHILHPSEITDAKTLLSPLPTDEWHYVTIPLSLNDLEKPAEWQHFFTKAKEKKVIPLVRLTTRFENGAWKIPTREETVKLLDFLNTLQWPTDQRHIIVFNEVNHAKEWGGQINPGQYGQVLRFVSTWLDAHQTNYVILPAAMDLAAPNGSETREAFTYLNQMADSDPDVLSLVDYWNSHSYPNPGFSAAPQRTAVNSLRGFEHELAYLQKKTGKEYQVFITETGWQSSKILDRSLEQYYDYALINIWSDSRVIAVTPFLLKGAPGPFSGFTFLDQNNLPTPQYTAYQKAVLKKQESILLYEEPQP